MRKIITERVDGKLPSLEGHTDLCVYGVRGDDDILICFCETPPVKTKKVAKKKKKKIEAPVIEEVSVDTHEFNLDFDPKH